MLFLLIPQGLLPLPAIAQQIPVEPRPNDHVVQLLPPVFVHLNGTQQEAVYHSQLFARGLRQAPQEVGGASAPVSSRPGFGDLYVSGVESLGTYALETPEGISLARAAAYYSNGSIPSQVVFTGLSIPIIGNFTLRELETGTEIPLQIPLPDDVVEIHTGLAAAQATSSAEAAGSSGGWTPYALYDAYNGKLLQTIDRKNPGVISLHTTSPSGCDLQGQVHYAGNWSQPLTTTELVISLSFPLPGDYNNPEWQLSYWGWSLYGGEPGIWRTQLPTDPSNQQIRTNAFKFGILTATAPQLTWPYYAPTAREIDWEPYHDRPLYWMAAASNALAAKYVAFTDDIGQWFHFALDTSGTMALTQNSA